MENNQVKAALGVAAVIGMLGLCAVGYFLLTVDNLAANFRDVLIILLAIESIVVGVFLILALWQLYQLTMLLQNEIKPLLNTTKETVEQVQHTTTFVGQSVAAPFISLSGLVVGTKAIVDTLRGKNEPHEVLRRDKRDG